jgi:GH15 family glucan-1,4-alpha-glucosidase
LSKQIEVDVLIGNCRCAASISPSGCIHWLCWPRFDSPAIFSTLLDDGGDTFALCLEGSFATSRRYIDESALLRNLFNATDAEFVLTDAMPIYPSMKQRTLLTPKHEIVRTLVYKRTIADSRP